MAYPGLAAITCSQCKQYVYQIPEGKLETYQTDEGDLPVLRYDVPTPCSTCPRGGPEYERNFRLSARNLEMVDLYDRVKASLGAYRVPDVLAEDRLFSENMLIVDRAIASAMAAMQAEAMEKVKVDSRGSV